jgi:antitoxin (DNA-binding transcriptional repressor) of toxin-antitoxin stability system
MGALSIRELNSNISKALARVEAGETLDILRNGKVIAELRPKDRKSNEAWRRAYKESVKILKEGLPGRIGQISEEDRYGNADL